MLKETLNNPVAASCLLAVLLYCLRRHFLLRNYSALPTAFKILWQRAVFAVIDRTPQQNETLGRFLHTLSASSFIGAATLMFSSDGSANYAGLRASILFVAGVIFFIEGMALNKGK